MEKKRLFSPMIIVPALLLVAVLTMGSVWGSTTARVRYTDSDETYDISNKNTTYYTNQDSDSVELSHSSQYGKVWDYEGSSDFIVMENSGYSWSGWVNVGSSKNLDIWYDPYHNWVEFSLAKNVVTKTITQFEMWVGHTQAFQWVGSAPSNCWVTDKGWLISWVSGNGSGCFYS